MAPNLFYRSVPSSMRLSKVGSNLHICMKTWVLHHLYDSDKCNLLEPMAIGDYSYTYVHHRVHYTVCITLYGKCNLQQTDGSSKFEPSEITVSTMYVSTMYVIKFCNVIGLYAFTSQWYLEVSIYDK